MVEEIKIFSFFFFFFFLPTSLPSSPGLYFSRMKPARSGAGNLMEGRYEEEKDATRRDWPQQEGD